MVRQRGSGVLWLACAAMWALACEPTTFGDLTTLIRLTHQQSSPALALDGAGQPMFAFADHSNDGKRRAFFQRWEPSQQRMSAPLELFERDLAFGEMQGEGFRPIAIAQDPVRGNVAVAIALDGATLALALSDPGGASWSTTVVHAAQEDVTVLGPALALHDGRIHLAFHREEISCGDDGSCLLRLDTVYLSGTDPGALEARSAPVIPGGYLTYRAPASLALDAAGAPGLAYFVGSFDGASWPANLWLVYWRPDRTEAAVVVSAEGFVNQRPTASLAFQGTSPRLAHHLRRGSDSASLFFSASEDGVSWPPPVPLPNPAGNTGGQFLALTFSTGGRAVVVEESTTPPGPQVFSSTDLVSWSVTAADASGELGAAGRYVSAAFDPAGALLASFAWIPRSDDDSPPLAPGILLWREPLAR